MQELQDDGVAVSGVYGINGVGKTTLVKHVGAQAQANGFFNTVVMATVSTSLELNKIQEQLADMLALNLSGQTIVEDRATELKKMILGGNKLLIILDDIWSKVPLSSIGIPNNEELQKCNSKVLFTTKIQKVCQEMHSDARIILGTLSKEDSMKLLLKKANMTFHESTEIVNRLAKEVATNYVGLPLSLIAAAREFRDKGLDELKEEAERLRGSQPAHPENEKHVVNYIKSCYDSLSTDVKSCLLLCCLFPKDYDIPVEDLFRYGIGKGLFKESNTLQKARAAADLVVKSFQDSRLILDSEKKGCVRMNVNREVVMSISSLEDGQYMFVKSGEDLTEWPKIEAYVNYSTISVMDNKIQCLPEDLECPKLIEILSFNGARSLNFRDFIFKSTNELRVLDLRQLQNLCLSENLSKLTNLRSLFIKCGCIKWDCLLPLLGKLGKLEILSMPQFSLHFFPKELEQLSKLRMLDISEPKHDGFPSQVISRLINLEELYMKGKLIWGRKELCCQEFIGLRKLNVLVVHIQDSGCLPKVVKFDPPWVKFDITIGKWESCDEYIAKLPQQDSQKCLCLNTTIIDLPDWFNKVVTERAEKLVYYWFRHMKNILAEYGTGRLHGVKYLAVIRYNARPISFKRRKFMKAVTLNVPVFENLEELHVEEIPCVELCVGELPLGSFSNLKKFKVLDCPNIENALLSSNSLKRLQSLEELICGDLSGIEFVFGTDGMEPEDIICTKLRKIHLRNLPNLINICNGPAPPHAIFQNLKSFAFGQCPARNYVFPNRSVVEYLVQLEELYVYSCPSMEAVIGASEEADNNDDMIEFPELKILCLVDLEKLTRFYGSAGSSRPIINCPKLEQRCLIGSCLFEFLNRSSFRSSKEVHEVHSTFDYRLIRERLHDESKARRSYSWKD